MSPRLPILAVLLILGGSLLADDAGSKLAGYHLKNRSSFSASEPRPPFWPIGWVHHDKAEQVVEVKPSIDVKMFSVSSILLGHPTLAVINGRAYEEGDLIHPAHLGAKDKDAPKTAMPANVRVRVQKIMDGSVVLISDNQTVTVPLRRPELSDHKSDKEEESLILGQ